PSARPVRKVNRQRAGRGGGGGRDGDRNRAKARSAGRSDGNDGNGRGRGQRRDASAVQGDGDGRDDAAVVAAHADLVDDDGPGSVEGHRPASTRSRRRRGGRTPEGANAVSESTQPTQVPTAVEFDIEGQRHAVEGFLIDLLAAFGRSDATVRGAVGQDARTEPC